CPEFHRKEADTGDVATRPIEAGGEANLDRVAPVTKTIGTVVVAALAASAEGVLPTITATCRRRRSATRSGNRSVLCSNERCSIATLCPSTKPASFSPSRNAVTRSLGTSVSDPLRRNPTTGIAGCWARAASGHAAAAPPSAASNSRRLMVTVMRPPVRGCVMQRYNATSALSYNGAAPGGQGRLDRAIGGDAIQ